VRTNAFLANPKFAVTFAAEILRCPQDDRFGQVQGAGTGGVKLLSC